MKKILIIQTAFIGDVILATSLVETLYHGKDKVLIDLVVRKGNESLLKGNPHVNRVLVWDKKKSKYLSLIDVSQEIRAEEYDAVINLQRFFSAGFLMIRSRAKVKYGFKTGWWSLFYTKSYKHVIGNGKHEIERNFELIKELGEFELKKPALFPTDFDQEEVRRLNITKPYVVMAPSSVWFTKQLPENKWVELIAAISSEQEICLVGAPSDKELLDRIIKQSQRPGIHNLCGQLGLLSSAFLMSGAKMNYVNDSAPLHLASAMNAPVSAYFCSTIPAFGFGPLSDHSRIFEVKETLSCRPCGLHGHKACPLGHFDCGNKISVSA